MSEEDCLRRDVIKQLICNFKLDYQPIEQQYGIQFTSHFAEDLKLLAPLSEDGLLTIGEKDIQVSAKGRLLIRNICLCLILIPENRRNANSSPELFKQTFEKPPHFGRKPCPFQKQIS